MWPPITPSQFRVAEVVLITIKEPEKVAKEVAQMFLKYNISRTDIVE